MRIFYIYIKLFLMVCLFIASTNLFSQENCGNGIDDDGDGLIDCLDPDCKTNLIPNSALFNTASDGNGGVLGGGSNDLNWQIAVGNIGGPYAPAIVMSNLPGSYYNSPWSDCSWISHSATGSHTVSTDFYYKIQFDLPCQNYCNTGNSDTVAFCIQMDFFSDNSVDEIYVNSIPQSNSISGIPVASPYSNVGFNSSGMVSASLCSGWVPGTNELIVKVSSGPAYEGFLAQYSTSAQIIEVPEPITGLIIPNVFTPNGDNYNDFYEIKGVNSTKDYEIKIYNRWGNLVFETTDPLTHWDGGGHNSGVYFYVLSYTEVCSDEPVIINGSLTLM